MGQADRVASQSFCIAVRTAQMQGFKVMQNYLFRGSLPGKCRPFMRCWACEARAKDHLSGTFEQVSKNSLSVDSATKCGFLFASSCFILELHFLDSYKGDSGSYVCCQLPVQSQESLEQVAKQHACLLGWRVLCSQVSESCRIRGFIIFHSFPLKRSTWKLPPDSERWTRAQCFYFQFYQQLHLQRDGGLGWGRDYLGELPYTAFS